MTVLDQLVYFASLYGEPPTRPRREALAWLDRFRIADYADRRAEELSKGNQQKVQFIAAVLHDPEVLLMDEPFTGLDPVNLVLLREAFLELRDRGRTLDLLDPPDGGGRGAVRVGRDRRPRPAGRRRHARATSSGRAGDGRSGSALEGEVGARLARRRCPASRAVRPGAGHVELELDAGRGARGDPRGRRSAAGRAVTQFEVADPSLEALFIEHVGRPADDDDSARDADASAASGARRRDGSPDGRAATRSCRTPGSSPGASTATASAARCSSSRRSC